MTNCGRCDEPILPGERAPSGGIPLHYECMVRSGAGSIAHLERRCSCYVPGSDEGDPEGMSKRDAARLVVARLQQR